MLTFLLSNANLFYNPYAFSNLVLNVNSLFENIPKVDSQKVSTS
jgi:hypothetical protein